MTLDSLLGPAPWPRRVATAALFLVPALALSVQSGYSYGAALLLVGALCSLHRWPRTAQHPWTWALAVATAGMGVLWFILANPMDGLGGWDRPSKYFFGLVCLLFVSLAAPKPRAQYWGLLLGCLGAGAVALWQVRVAGVPRATGFPSSHTSSAIQWGNLALLMGTMLAAQTIALREHITRATLVLACFGVLLAFNASVLSQSRGGWLAIGLASPVGLYLLWRFYRPELWRMLGSVAAILVLLGAANHQVLVERWRIMEKELQVYGAQREADNSVGQRLEHWRFAWEVGQEKPLLGWGTQGYLAEKEKRVAAGEYASSILEYNAHNEVLDMFVKAGIVGVAWLLLFYAVPLCMFWPTRARLAAYADCRADVRAQMLALRLGGVCIPLLYAGFGITVVFLGPNSGIMFYLFMTMLTWAAVRGMDAQYAGDVRAPSSAAT